MSAVNSHKLLRVFAIGVFYVSASNGLVEVEERNFSSRLYQNDYREILHLEDEKVDSISNVKWSPSGERIASRGGDTIHIWDVTSGGLLSVIDADGVSTLSWSPDGLMLAGAGSSKCDTDEFGQSGFASIWDVETGIHKTHFFVECDPPLFQVASIASVAWSPNGAILAAGGRDGSLYLWSIQTGEALEGQLPPVLFLSETYYINAIRWDPDGTKLAIANNEGIGILGVDENGLTDEGQSLVLDPANLLGETYLIAWHPNGSYLASVGVDRVIRIWDLDTEQSLFTFGDDEMWIDLDWSPDGAILASVNEAGAVIFWDAETGEELTELPIHNVTSFDWNPDGTQFAVGEADGMIAIWSAATNGNN